jgi:hypothetical protein
MNRTARILLIVAGVACFAAAAAATFGWVDDLNPTGVALLGFACWLASTLP